MPLSDADFVRHQREVLDKYFALAPGEEELRQRFESLALETRACIAGKVIDGVFVPYPSASNFADYDRGAGDLVSPSLRKRWREWKREYDLLLKRQPILELRDMLHSISESHNSSSWPAGWESKIRDWVDAGELHPPPFEDIKGVATADFFARLREIRDSTGGWLYWSKDSRSVRFVVDHPRH